LRALLALLALAGCDKVLSLNDIQVSPGALVVNGSYGVRRVLNSATRLPFTSDDLPAGRAPQGTFVQLADGNKAQLVWGAGDHFYFNRAAGTQAYRIVFQGTDPTPTIEYQLAVDDVSLLNRLWGRSKRMTASAGTALHYSLTIPSGLANPFEYVASSGIWTETPIGPTQTLDWPTAGIAAAAGPIALLDATPLVNNDRAYYLIYAQQGTGPTMYTRLVYYRFDDVTMTDAEVTGLPATPAPFPINADTCVDVDARRADEITRITGAGYVGAAPATASWVLNALPVMAMGTDVTMLVAYSSGTDNYANQVSFGTPFGGYDLALQLVATAPHPLMAPGATAPVVVSYGSVNYNQPLTTTTCTQPARFNLLPELPTAPLLDGASLDDEQLQLDRSRLAKLTWTTVPGGTTTQLFRADLYEVSAGTNNVTTLALRATWYTTNHTVDGNPQILVDPSLLKFGKSYAIQISDEIGYPDAASGDLTTITYPLAIGFAWTGVLQVAN
jgi:hypothetical protein